MRDDVFLPGRLAELCVPLKHVTKPVLAGITLVLIEYPRGMPVDISGWQRA